MDMNSLRVLIKKATKEKLAVELQSAHFDECVTIEPEDEYTSVNGEYLIINEKMIIDLSKVGLAKLVPSSEQRLQEWRELWDQAGLKGVDLE